MAATAATPTDLTQRARKLIDEVHTFRAELDQYKASNSKSNDETCPLQPDLSYEIVDASKALVHDLTELYYYWMDVASGYMETQAFEVFMRLRLHEKLPDCGDISVQELSTAVGVDVQRLGRILRLLVLRFCITQTRPGYFAHGAASRWLVRNGSVAAYVETALDIFQKAATSLADTILLDRPGEIGDGTSFTTRFGEDLYSYWKKHESKMQRFQMGMHDRRLVQEAVNSYPWDVLQGKVVDVGGGNGQIAVQIALLNPHLDFVVQDTFVNDDRVKLVNSLGLEGRVRFEVHDYYQPQSITDASVFFIKHCLHNNDDQNCIRILKALVPALENSPTNPVLLVSEYVLPEENDTTVSRELARQLHNCDVAMMVLFNAMERTASQYQALLTAADPRLKILKVHHVGNDRLSTMEIRLDKSLPKNTVDG
ncbi:uncharacterized protein Z518_00664 [Rhinocladiella mackenziei CBS 650.93]|uniref:O-methyltransferase domain-containing protein n=1 Tax=Rhinocladiella mackenziei CBS 650.93 TaxID=1442369 RepID=A0A0D2IU48_9EURO|nr:uncharacterized protein Z518_00664 [Rhinocladiella mackenziei CBS 650.93]KIX09584.1 hypothetical protein Z518_00664 [Rhinocladiella mackenziei CBS 650.93]